MLIPVWAEHNPLLTSNVANPFKPQAASIISHNKNSPSSLDLDAHGAQKTMENSGHLEQPEQQKVNAQVGQGVGSQKSTAGEVSQLFVPYFPDLPHNRNTE